jgi:hypothetical protein
MNSSNDLNEQVSALQRQVFALLLALIVVSGTLTVYLYRQASVTRKDTDALQQQAGPVIAIFRQNQAAMINFVNQLVIYSETHPDFRPVLLKFGITPPTSEPKK